jgi:hypothetical protein
MRILALSVLVVMAAGAIMAQKRPKASQQHWQNYVFPDDEFSINLPSPPNPQDENGDKHIHLYTAHLGTTVFTLRVITRAMDCESGLAEMWDSANNRRPGEEPVIPGSLKQVSLAEMRGMEFETDLGSGQRSLHSFYCIDSRKFYVFNIGYQGKHRPPEVERIMNSFHLVNPAHH